MDEQTLLSLSEDAPPLPERQLIILFDIDGTIVDTRYMVLHALNTFDQIHGTSYFHELDVSHVTMHEDQAEDLLAALDIPPSVREQVSNWYRSTRWSSKAILESHRPYHGVMEVMRWFRCSPTPSWASIPDAPRLYARTPYAP